MNYEEITIAEKSEQRLQSDCAWSSDHVNKLIEGPTQNINFASVEDYSKPDLKKFKSYRNKRQKMVLQPLTFCQRKMTRAKFARE
jgi:hypothetical protein